MKTKQPKQPDGPSPKTATRKFPIPDAIFAEHKLSWSNRDRLQLLKGHILPTDVVYVGRNRSLGGGLITDGVHWGNPFRVPSEIYARAARYRGLGAEGGRDEYWALRDYFMDAVRKFVWLVACEPEIQQRVKKELKAKVFVCHCHEDFSCHGNVLWQLANNPAFREILGLEMLGIDELPTCFRKERAWEFYAKRTPKDPYWIEFFKKEEYENR
jgi:Domain of unknown function (DUF4326)